MLVVVLALRQQRPPLVGDNGVRPGAFVAKLAPQRPVCMGLGSSVLPADVVRVTLAAGAAGPQPIAVTFPGTRLRTSVDGYADGPVDVRLPARRPASAGVACLRNEGDVAVQVAGEPGGGATVGGRPQPYGISFLLLADEPPTWWSHLGTTLERVGTARGGAGGPVTGWIVVGLVAVIVLLALGAAARWAR